MQKIQTIFGTSLIIVIILLNFKNCLALKEFKLEEYTRNCFSDEELENAIYDYDTLNTYGKDMYEHSGYRKDKNYIYYNWCIIRGGDAASFEPYRDKEDQYSRYGRDKFHVYKGREIMEGAEAESFEVLEYGYSKDINKVYYNIETIPEANPASFRLEKIGETEIGKDDNFLYINGKTLKEIDINKVKYKESYSAYKQLIITDDENVYISENYIEGADPINFDKLKELDFVYYYGDKNQVLSIKYLGRKLVYDGGYGDTKYVDLGVEIKIIPNSNANYFDFGYVVGEDGVYWYGKKIEEADPETFEILRAEDGYAKDKNNVYFEGVPTGDDPKTVAKIVINDIGVYVDKDGFLSGNSKMIEKTNEELKEEYPEANAQIDEALEKAEEEYEDKYPGYEPQPTPPSQIFTDVPATDENYKLTREAYDQGWLNGHPDGSLRLNEPVNRAEFAKMLMQAFSRGRGNTTELKKFPDVARTSWYGEVLARAVELKVMEGYPDGKMRPENSINRAEALKMTFETRGRGSLDYDSKEEWYEKYVKYTKKEIDRTCAEGSCEYLTFLNDGDMSKAMTRGDCIKLILRSL